MAEVNTTLAAVLARIARMPGLQGNGYAPGGLVSIDQCDPPLTPELVSRSPYTLAAMPVLRDAWRDWRDRIVPPIAPSWPSRPPAPWRIWTVNREWSIEKRVGDGYETWCRFDTSAEAFAAFAAGGA